MSVGPDGLAHVDVETRGGGKLPTGVFGVLVEFADGGVVVEYGDKKILVLVPFCKSGIKLYVMVVLATGTPPYCV